MIDKVFYNKKMDEAIELMGAQMKRKTLDLIYEKIRYNYENSDLEEALDIITSNTDRLNYYVLIKNLDKCASERRERENMIEKKAAEEDAKRFWHESYRYANEGICDHKCTQCHVVHCVIIASESLRAIRSLLNGEKTLKQINTDLSAKFDIYDLLNYPS